MMGLCMQTVQQHAVVCDMAPEFRSVGFRVPPGGFFEKPGASKRPVLCFELFKFSMWAAVEDVGSKFHYEEP